MRSNYESISIVVVDDVEERVSVGDVLDGAHILEAHSAQQLSIIIIDILGCLFYC